MRITLFSLPEKKQYNGKYTVSITHRKNSRYNKKLKPSSWAFFC